jgi:hypothetical protein
MTTNFFHPSLLLLFLDAGSGMGKNQDPRSGINIADPQHWIFQMVEGIIFLTKKYWEDERKVDSLIPPAWWGNCSRTAHR